MLIHALTLSAALAFGNPSTELSVLFQQKGSLEQAIAAWDKGGDRDDDARGCRVLGQYEAVGLRRDQGTQEAPALAEARDFCQDTTVFNRADKRKKALKAANSEVARIRAILDFSHFDPATAILRDPSLEDLEAAKTAAQSHEAELAELKKKVSDLHGQVGQLQSALASCQAAVVPKSYICKINLFGYDFFGEGSSKESATWSMLDKCNAKFAPVQCNSQTPVCQPK